MNPTLTAVRFAASLSAILARAVADGLERVAVSIAAQQEKAPDSVPAWMWSE